MAVSSPVTSTKFIKMESFNTHSQPILKDYSQLLQNYKGSRYPLFCKNSTNMHKTNLADKVIKSINKLKQDENIDEKKINTCAQELESFWLEDVKFEKDNPTKNLSTLIKKIIIDLHTYAREKEYDLTIINKIKGGIAQTEENFQNQSKYRQDIYYDI